MGSIEKRALAAAGAIFVIGSFFTIIELEFPTLNVLTVHLYMMFFAGILMCLPLISEESDVGELNSKVKRMADDLKQIMERVEEEK